MMQRSGGMVTDKITCPKRKIAVEDVEEDTARAFAKSDVVIIEKHVAI